MDSFLQGGNVIFFLSYWLLIVALPPICRPP